ncbi:hypothetical protein FB561_3121 [Kribbella amoyensis]|uniref:Uncharacterized protein n=1 Tax=Kribbella amoyensis TaxID=996641 RepID=A0A561BSY4_9ACTN|nr:DUF5947 family protein [Kribbella amoyensis]TWD81997.1 hypothetical protein FB561_3121 [Kribbella amoyensis]
MRTSASLRSLARGSPVRPQGPAATPDPAAVLGRFTGGSRAQGAPGEQCEMCAVPIGPVHPHVADVPDHRLLCTCRPCYLLFSTTAASRGHYRAVPETYRHYADFALTPAQWDSLGIPVDLAFFYRQTEGDRYVAFYPSPGGATESLLDLAGWDEVVAANPLLGELIPDVEAVLLRRTGDGVECHLVPIDACYELVGLVRQSWEGFAGGEEVWQRIDEFFARIRERGDG